MELLIHNYFEFLSFLVCLFCIRKLKGSYMVLFLPYLLFITIGEVAANSFWITPPPDNSNVYTIIGVVTYYFYSYIFYKLAQNKGFRTTILILGALFTVFTIFMLLKFGFQAVTQIILFTSIVMTIFPCLYFYFAMQSDDDINEANYLPAMLINAGVLIFYLGIIFCFSMRDYIVSNELTIDGIKLHKLIPRYLSIILYSCFCISFVVWRPTRKISAKQ